MISLSRGSPWASSLILVVALVPGVIALSWATTKSTRRRRGWHSAARLQGAASASVSASAGQSVCLTSAFETLTAREHFLVLADEVSAEGAAGADYQDRYGSSEWLQSFEAEIANFTGKGRLVGRAGVRFRFGVG